MNRCNYIKLKNYKVVKKYFKKKYFNTTSLKNLITFVNISFLLFIVPVSVIFYISEDKPKFTIIFLFCALFCTMLFITILAIISLWVDSSSISRKIIKNDLWDSIEFKHNIVTFSKKSLELDLKYNEISKIECGKKKSPYHFWKNVVIRVLKIYTVNQKVYLVEIILDAYENQNDIITTFNTIQVNNEFDFVHENCRK